MLESPDAFPGVRLPKLDGVVVAGSGEDHLKGEGHVKTHRRTVREQTKTWFKNLMTNDI